VKEIIATLIAWGPWGLFLFALVDGAGVPTPNGLDFLLLLLTANRPSFAYGFAAITLVGSALGCMFLFFVARKGGEAVLEKYRRRPRFQRFERWFQHYGMLTVFIPALLPIPLPLKFFILCAGVFEVRPLVFLATLLAARLPRYFALAYLGARLGTESLARLNSQKLQILGITIVQYNII
jgi:membrane protein YqaA with SNARE-associated domain